MQVPINLNNLKNIGTNCQSKINSMLTPCVANKPETRSDVFVGVWKQIVNSGARGSAAIPGVLDVIPGPAGRVSKPQQAVCMVTGSLGALIALLIGKPKAGFDIGQRAGAVATRFSAQIANVLIAAGKTVFAAVACAIAAVVGLVPATNSALRFTSYEKHVKNDIAEMHKTSARMQADLDSLPLSSPTS